MAVKQQEVRIRAGKVMCSRADDYMKIEIEDPISGIQFIEVDLPFTEFGQMLSGSSVNVQAELRGLEFVGMKREYEKAKVTISEDDYNKLTRGTKYEEGKNRLSEWLKTNHAREGWMMDTYLGSQTSIQRDYKTCMYILNFGYFRYVDPS